MPENPIGTAYSPPFQGASAHVSTDVQCSVTVLTTLKAEHTATREWP